MKTILFGLQGQIILILGNFHHTMPGAFPFMQCSYSVLKYIFSSTFFLALLFMKEMLRSLYTLRLKSQNNSEIRGTSFYQTDMATEFIAIPPTNN